MMRDRRDTARWPFVGIMLVLLALYPLSIGPLIWVCHHGYLDGTPLWVTTAIDWYTWPLSELTGLWRTGNSIMGWYIELWVPGYFS